MEAIRQVLEHLQQTQAEEVEAAADLVVGAWKRGGAVFCSDIGHGNHQDFLNRAGGLAGVHYFGFQFNVTSPVAGSLQEERELSKDELAQLNMRHALKTSNLKSGDVILTSSVSGRSIRPVELALACREEGISVVALTAMDYARQSEPQHPSGKKLHEVADVVLDIGAPYGDAAVEVPGYQFPVMPVSGVAMTVAGWLIWGRVMEKTAEEGDPATVFVSVNREGGKEAHRKSLERFNQRGF